MRCFVIFTSRRVPQPLEAFCKSWTRTTFVERWARERIGDVGMMGLQRKPMQGDDWRTIVTLEKRLLSCIDSIAVLGEPALNYIERYALDAPIADPNRIFATTTIIVGSIEGRDALAVVERVLHRFGAGDPLVAQAFGGA